MRRGILNAACSISYGLAAKAPLFAQTNCKLSSRKLGGANSPLGINSLPTKQIQPTLKNRAADLRVQCLKPEAKKGLLLFS